MFEALMLLRHHSYDERLYWCSSYYVEGFKATFTDKKATWRISGYLANYLDEVFEMAQMKKKVGVSDVRSNGESFQWVNVNLTNADVMEIEQWISSEPDILGEVCRVVLSGYHVAVKPATNGDGFMASISGAVASGSKGSAGVSAFSDTPYEAIACVLFKFVSKLDCTLSPTPTEGRAKFR